MAASHEELERYYASMGDVYGFDATCKMTLPDELETRTVLDLCCRRGKGVYKLLDRVGARGRVIGVDWRADMIEAARTGLQKAASKSGVSPEAAELHVAYPEELGSVVEPQSVDVAYVNSVINILCDPGAVLRACFEALRPGGLLVCETVLATGPRKADIVEQARSLGNAVQAAPHRNEFVARLANAGFDPTTLGTFTLGKVAPDTDADGQPTVPVAESDEPIGFVAVCIHAQRPDGIDHHSQRILNDISQFR